MLLNANSWENLCSTTDFICIKSHRAQINRVFFQIQFITQTIHTESATWLLLCDVLHYTNMNNFTDLRNDICYNHLMDLNQCIMFQVVPTDKINASIRICIRRILKVKIRIPAVQILTSFVTSLEKILLKSPLCLLFQFCHNCPV